ncbi:hypothetical protein BH20ACT6_BH20ACT6_10470 [soil metagenome]
MRPADVAEVERLTAHTYLDVDRRTRLPGTPEPALRSVEQAAAWRRHAEHVLRHDGPGCWVADGPAGLVGVTMSMRRDTMWLLAAYAVLPAAQGQGLGTRLLDTALEYGAGCLRGMVVSSPDPRAARRYRSARFDLHPTMHGLGEVRREALPVPEDVREATAADIDLADSVDRRTRGSGHGIDHPLLAATMPMLVVDRPGGQGYCYLRSPGTVYLLAATNERTAARLLWAALGSGLAGQPVRVPHVTAANQWALDVIVAAGLDVQTQGYLALRGMRPPAPYLPSGHFL